MVIEKLFEYFEDLKRYCDDRKWGKFYREYQDDHSAFEGYDTYFNNSYDGYSDAAEDLLCEICEYFDLTWNDVADKPRWIEDEKQDPKKWLDDTQRYLRSTIISFGEESNEQCGFLLKGYQMLKWIEDAARKSPDEYYGKYTGCQMPYYLGESKLKEDAPQVCFCPDCGGPISPENVCLECGEQWTDEELVYADDDEAVYDEDLEEFYEAIIDFDKKNHGMYRYAKRKHDETKAIRKVSKEPYWVHPEGVAKIIMEHGGSDIEIKAGMAHDLLEDTGCVYSDLVEKFGEKVASIVKEVTNDKAEIEKVGKERYISEELVRLSPEALTVKLADMLYNMKDSPTEKNYERMRKNVMFLMVNRELTGAHCQLVEEILAV